MRPTLIDTVIVGVLIAVALGSRTVAPVVGCAVAGLVYGVASTAVVRRR